MRLKQFLNVKFFKILFSPRKKKENVPLQHIEEIISVHVYIIRIDTCIFAMTLSPARQPFKIYALIALLF